MIQFVDGYEVRICRSIFDQSLQCRDWELESHYFVDRAGADSFFQRQRTICSSSVPIIQLRSCELECEYFRDNTYRVKDHYAGDVIQEMALTEAGIEVY